MGRMIRAAMLCLLWGLGGAVVTLLAGIAWIELGSAGLEGSQAMGRAILVIFYLTPAGFVLGLVAGAVSIWRAGR